MGEPDTLANIVVEIVAALAQEVEGDERESLLERLEVLRRLDLSGSDFSPEAFLRSEVERALGL